MRMFDVGRCCPTLVLLIFYCWENDDEMLIIILPKLRTQLLSRFGAQACAEIRALSQQLPWTAAIRGKVLCGAMPLQIRRQVAATTRGCALPTKPYKNCIYLNLENFTEFRDVLCTIVHELRHLWQNTVYQRQMPALRVPLDRKQPYQSKPIEIDARQAALCWRYRLSQSEQINTHWPLDKRQFGLEELRDPLTSMYVSAMLFGTRRRP